MPHKLIIFFELIFILLLVILSAILYKNNNSPVSQETFDFSIISQESLYGYKILNTYPHDKNSYTQGLAVDNEFLYVPRVESL